MLGAVSIQHILALVGKAIKLYLHVFVSLMKEISRMFSQKSKQELIYLLKSASCEAIP